MARSGQSGRIQRRPATRPGFEILEGRSLPSGIGFTSAIGVGVTGSYAAIRSNAVTTDSVGDTYVTGSFRGTAGFNPSSSGSRFTTNNTQDAYVVKYSPTGSLIWAVTFAGQATTSTGGSTTYATSQGSAIAVDGSGNVFVSGDFSGNMSLTGASGVAQVSSAASADEPFVAKLTPTGSVSWFDAIAGTAYDDDSANGLTPDGSGGVEIVGAFSDSATFGSTTLSAGGESDAYAARINGSGTFLWAVATQGANGSNAVAEGIAVDGSGNLDIAGFFSSSVDFDPSNSKTMLTSTGSDDAAVWKLGPNGNFLWARSYGSTDFDAATAVAVDSSGNLYATGAFSDTVNFGTTSKPDSLTAGPIYDAFVLKVDPNGNEVWVKGLVGSSGSAKGLGIALDAAGNIHLAGTFSGPLDFDPNGGADLLTSVGYSDIFSAGYDPNGNLVYALQAGTVNANVATSVAVDPTGDVAITGSYSGSVAFGPSTLSTFAQGSIFVARVVTQFAPIAPSAPVLEASSDSGSSQTDGITNDTSPVFDVNTAAATDTVELLRNGVVVAQRIGPGALPDGGPLTNGTYTYTAVQVSPFGLASPASGSCAVTILTTPPATPPAPTLYAADDSGTLGDGITNVNQPRLVIVIAKGGVTVQLLNTAGTVIGSAYAPTAGSCLVTPSQPFTDGVYAIRARAIDVAGNVGVVSPAFTLTIDTTRPTAPSAPTLLPADDSGTLGDGITNVRQPRFTGTAGPNSTVTLLGGGIVIGIAIAASNGAYTVQPSSLLADGTYTLSAFATDLAGNQGPASSSTILTILGTRPTAPATPSIVPADVSGPAGSNLTNVKQPRITGTAKPGTTVEILNASGIVLASATVGTGGSFTAQVSSPLADGTYTIDAIAVDVAGNISPASPKLTLTIDTTPPVAPSAPTLLPADDSGTLGDGITNVRQPRLTGTAEPNSTVSLLTGGTVIGTAVATSGGAYAVKPSSPLADGTYTLTVRATDAAGNQGAASSSATLTILGTPPTAPTAPAILAADDSGGPNLTNVRQPRLTGQTVANATVQLIGSTGTVLATATSMATGSYMAKVASPLADGTYMIHAVVTDVAGNVSPAGATFSLTILATPPAAPSVPTLLPADDSGTVGDRITNVRQPRLTGTSTPGLTVHLLNASNAVLGTATVSATGAITVAPSAPLADGTYVLDFVVVDAAGNVGAAGPAISLTILGTPPPKPPAPTLLAADDTGVLGDGMTSVRRPRIVGTAQAGGQVAWLSATGAVLVSTTASATGAYQLQIPTALANGTDPVTVRVTDVAGNVSPTSPAFNLTIRADVGDDFGNGQADISVFNPTLADFYVQRPTTAALYLQQFGGTGDVPINGDFFGNGHNDIALYRPSTSTFFAYDPVTGAFKTAVVGQPGDVPVPADYDGDGLTDFAAYAPKTATYSILKSTTNTIATYQFGVAAGIPVPADYFGNGHADYAFYLPSTSTFYILDVIANQAKIVTVGLPGSTPVPADYEGLGHADPAVYEPATGTFVIDKTSGAFYTRQFGPDGSIPVPGDYLGTGRADIAIDWPATATFLALDIVTSATKVVSWGTPNVTWPTMAPITLWFSFATSTAGNEIQPTLILADAVATEGPIALITEVEVAPASKSTALDALGLDGWPPIN